MSLKESAGYIVPVTRSAADQIEEWQGAGLNVPSGVKAQLANVEERLLVKIIGSLTAVDRQESREPTARRGAVLTRRDGESGLGS